MIKGSEWKEHVVAVDERREKIVPGDSKETVTFCVEHFLALAKESIAIRGRFTVALSGGSTPKAIFEALPYSPLVETVDWSRVYIFWSDERSVPPESDDSNYKMAMDAGIAKLPIPKKQIFRMVAEDAIEENAKTYEKLIQTHVPNAIFDLVMLGMGNDGHTASLFPETHGLSVENRLVIANYVPQMETWRMSLTFSCINQARHSAIYVLGTGKAAMVKRIFNDPYEPQKLPIQRIGTAEHKALWILDSGVYTDRDSRFGF